MFFGPQTTKHVLILTAAITLGGCTSNGNDAYNTTFNEPPRATASKVQYSHDVRFDGSSLGMDERERLEGFLAQINLHRSDSVYLIAGSRSATGKLLLGDYLSGRGVSIRSPRSDFGLKIPSADSVSIVVRRYVATLPGCPDWTGALNSYSNTPSSNWGCATATNLGLMVAEPGDLVHGRDAGSCGCGDHVTDRPSFWNCVL